MNSDKRTAQHFLCNFTNFVNFSLPAIARGATGAGAVNSLRDHDGVVRRMPLAIEYGGHEYLPLGLAVALGDQGRPRDATYVAGEPTLVAGDYILPVGETASITLDVLGHDQIARVSAADVLAGTANAAALTGKLVFGDSAFQSASFAAQVARLSPCTSSTKRPTGMAENVQ